MTDYLTAPLMGEALGIPVKKKALAQALTGGRARTAWLNEKARKAEDTLGYYLGPAAKPIEALGAVLDFTDAGDMVAAADASRELWNNPSIGSAANYAAAGAAMALPFYSARMGQGVADLADDARRFVTDEDGAIRLWHGSPHDFDKFSMDAIGTGEGAQAYGHGLYFAENADVARDYQRSVQRNPEQLRSIAEGYGLSGDAAEMLSYQFSMNDFHGQGFDKWLDGLKDQTEKGWTSGRTKEAVDQVLRLEVEASDAVREMKTPGRLYEVDVNANPEDFLDWDAPLSAQPEKVREGILSVNAGNDPLLRELLDTSPEGMMMQGMVPNAKGSAAYRTLMERGFEDGAVGLNLPAGNPMKPADKWATERLREAGIPGIKYLDAGSRGAGDGSRNYVVFDENLVQIVRKYGIAGAAAVLGVSASDVQAAIQPMTDMQADEETLKDYLGL